MRSRVFVLQICKVVVYVAATLNTTGKMVKRNRTSTNRTHQKKSHVEVSLQSKKFIKTSPERCREGYRALTVLNGNVQEWITSANSG